MHITFLGTRGGIKITSAAHKRHSVVLLEYGRTRILIDAGEQWAGRLSAYNPHAIFLTHAHSDHVGALKKGAPCPVYATHDVWSTIGNWPIDEHYVIKDQERITIGHFTLQPFSVVHSLIAPAVGYRITAGKHTIFYVSDLVRIRAEKKALHSIDLYIGDGASFVRPVIRLREGSQIGHASIKQQLAWCQQEQVPRAIFTHCGSQVVRLPYKTAQERVQMLGQVVGVPAELARDGMQIEL